MMSEKSPAFQFYPNDWLSSSSVLRMSVEQRGAYMQLLCHDWNDDGIEDNEETLALLSGLGETWSKGGSTVVKRCFVIHPNHPSKITNPRLMEEREKQRAWKAKSAKGGRKSGRKRREGCLKGGSTKREPKGNTISISSSSTNIRESFDLFWNSYPRKIGKVKAFDSFLAGNCAEASDSILAAVAAQRRDGGPLDPEQEERFIPHPTTWLNQRRWEDEAGATEPMTPDRYSSAQLAAFTGWLAAAYPGETEKHPMEIIPAWRREFDAWLKSEAIA